MKLIHTYSFRYYDIVRDVRQNKGSILKASVEYIKKLKSDQHKKRLLEEKVRIMESQNRKLLLKLQVIYIDNILLLVYYYRSNYYRSNTTHKLL